MRAYRCPRCQALLDLTAWSCARCGAAVGFALDPGVVLELDAATGSMWVRCIGSGGDGLQLAGAAWRERPLRVVPADPDRARRR